MIGADVATICVVAVCVVIVDACLVEVDDVCVDTNDDEVIVCVGVCGGDVWG